METFVKALFFIVLAFFVASQLSEIDFRLNNTSSSYSNTTDELTPRDQYITSYDTNNDNIVSDEEYRRGELERIQEEVDILRERVAEALQESKESPYADTIHLEEGNALERDPDEEYLIIENSGNRTISITGWKLKSLVSGRTIIIPKGKRLNTSLSRLGRNFLTVSLRNWDEAIIITGESTSRSILNTTVGEWHVFLRQNRQLWNNEREAILLLDKNDQTVDVLTY